MPKTRIVRQLRNGQITIPKEFREALHLDGDDLLAVTLQDGRLEIETIKAANKRPGSQWARDLYDLFAPARASVAGYSDREINEAIDDALRAYREEKR